MGGLHPSAGPRTGQHPQLSPQCSRMSGSALVDASRSAGEDENSPAIDDSTKNDACADLRLAQGGGERTSFRKGRVTKSPQSSRESVNCDRGVVKLVNTARERVPGSAHKPGVCRFKSCHPDHSSFNGSLRLNPFHAWESLRTNEAKRRRRLAVSKTATPVLSHYGRVREGGLRRCTRSLLLWLWCCR